MYKEIRDRMAKVMAHKPKLTVASDHWDDWVDMLSEVNALEDDADDADLDIANIPHCAVSAVEFLDHALSTEECPYSITREESAAAMESLINAMSEFGMGGDESEAHIELVTYFEWCALLDKVARYISISGPMRDPDDDIDDDIDADIEANLDKNMLLAIEFYEACDIALDEDPEIRWARRQLRLMESSRRPVSELFSQAGVSQKDYEAMVEERENAKESCCSSGDTSAEG